MFRSIAVLCAFTFSTATLSASDPQPNRASVRVDAGKHTVVLTAGPWSVAPNPEGYAASAHSHHSQPALQEFTWPVNGWVRGFKLRVIDAAGRDLPRALIHHLGVVNFARRQLVLGAPERLLAIGQETGDAHLPATVGIPVTAGMPMGITMGWFNETSATIPDARIELTIEYLPANQNPAPISVLPLVVSVIKEVGVPSGFDIPPGASSWQADFHVPMNGRVLGAGAHMHDNGVEVSLLDASFPNPKNLLTLTANRAADGKVTGMTRALPGVTGSGFKMQTDHNYRIVGRYLNPTKSVLAKSAMVSMALLFAPDDMRKLPAVDVKNPDWVKDLTYVGKPDRMVETGEKR